MGLTGGGVQPRRVAGLRRRQHLLLRRRLPSPNRASQAAALRAVNAYLPAARDIDAAFRRLLDFSGFPLQDAASFEDELLAVLRLVGCPQNLARSSLKFPGTPHLTGDVHKFEARSAVVMFLDTMVNEEESSLQHLEKELEAKLAEARRMAAEKEELV